MIKGNDFISLLVFAGILFMLFKISKKMEKTKRKKLEQSNVPDKSFVDDETMNKVLRYNFKKSSLDNDANLLMDITPADFSSTDQYHPDYSDILGIINEYSKGSIFNAANTPVLRVVDAEKRDVYPWCSKFVFELARRAGCSLKIIDIIRVRKYITEDESKYQFDVVLQKDGPIITKVKMVLRVSCVFKFDYATEGSFFKANTSLFKPTPELDEIFIVGFTTNYYDILSERNSEYYSFTNMENDEVIDPETIQRVLRRRKYQKDNESRALNILWDENGNQPDFLYDFGTSMIERCE